MGKKDRVKIRFLLSAAFFVLLAVCFFVYGVLWLINVPVDEKAELYRTEQLKKQSGADESAYQKSPLTLNRKENCSTCHTETNWNEISYNPAKKKCSSCHHKNESTIDKPKSK
jgi:hypothetical protein